MIEIDPQRAPLPEGSMITAELVITSFFDSDGKMRYATNIGGDPNLAQALGLCELAKLAIVKVYEMNLGDEE